MRLLISVRDGSEASAALAGGADLIDAKDPTAGALGAVALQTLVEIHRVVERARPVTAALGDAFTEDTTEQLACAFASAGTAFVKIGFAGVSDQRHAAALIRAAVRGARAGSDMACRVIAVAYADSCFARSLPLGQLNAVAATAGAAGVLTRYGRQTRPRTPSSRGPSNPHTLVLAKPFGGTSSRGRRTTDSA